MNLHAIAGPLVAAVNPTVAATVYVSTGATENAAGKPVPTYAAPVTVPAQVQALTGRDLLQVQGLNLNGTKRAIYLYGAIEGINRAEDKGGDKIVFGSGVGAPLAGTTWIVAQVLEQWGVGTAEEWCKVAVTEQQPGS